MAYGPAPENRNAAMKWMASRANQIGHFIDGVLRRQRMILKVEIWLPTKSSQN